MRRSGRARTSRSNVARSQGAKLRGGWRRTSFLPAFAFSASRRFSMTCSGGLRHHVAALVEALAPGAAGDLVEVARREHRRLLAVVLREAAEEYRADGHVDPDPQRVGAADDLQQAALGELLGEHAVARQQTGVVDADAVLQPGADAGTVGRREAHVLDGRGQRLLLGARGDLQAGEALGARRGVLLGEVDHVDRHPVRLHEPFHGPRERLFGVGVLQRHRPLARRDGRRLPAGAPGQLLLEERHVAQRRRHQQETRLRQGQQRRLPGHAAVPVGVPVEFVHHHVVHRGLLPLAQRHVGQDLGRAAQQRGIAVDGGVAGGQAHVVGPELAAQRHPLLVDQRLDGAGVDRAPPAGERREVQGERGQRLARAGRRVQDDVPVLEERQDGLFLGGIERQAQSVDVVEKAVQQIVAGRLAGRQQVEQGCWHGEIVALLRPLRPGARRPAHASSAMTGAWSDAISPSFFLR